MSKLNLYSQIDCIKYPLITDKTTRLFNLNKYTFVVDPKISKEQKEIFLETIKNLISQKK